MAKEKHGFEGEYNYYVGVLCKDNEIRFVDTVDYHDRSATWTAGAEAMAMSKRSAIQLQMELRCKGTIALVIESPDFQTLQNREAYD